MEKIERSENAMMTAAAVAALGVGALVVPWVGVLCGLAACVAVFGLLVFTAFAIIALCRAVAQVGHVLGVALGCKP